MANMVFPRFTDWVLRNGGLAAVDLRAVLLSVTTSVTGEPDAEFLDDFTTLAETDSPEHVRQDIPNVQLNYEARLRTELDSDQADFGVLNEGPSKLLVAGCLFYAHLGGGTDAENRPIEWVDTVAAGGPVFPYQLNGASVAVKPVGTGWVTYISEGTSL